MSHEVLITRRQSIFDFFANPGRGGPQKVGAGRCWLVGMLRPPSAWICKKIKNALSPGYQDLMGHLILTTSPWSILTWITLTHSVLPYPASTSHNTAMRQLYFGGVKLVHFCVKALLSRDVCYPSSLSSAGSKQSHIDKFCGGVSLTQLNYCSHALYDCDYDYDNDKK